MMPKASAQEEVPFVLELTDAESAALVMPIVI